VGKCTCCVSAADKCFHQTSQPRTCTRYDQKNGTYPRHRRERQGRPSIRNNSCLLREITAINERPTTNRGVCVLNYKKLPPNSAFGRTHENKRLYHTRRISLSRPLHRRSCAATFDSYSLIASKFTSQTNYAYICILPCKPHQTNETGRSSTCRGQKRPATRSAWVGINHLRDLGTPLDRSSTLDVDALVSHPNLVGWAPASIPEERWAPLLKNNSPVQRGFLRDFQRRERSEWGLYVSLLSYSRPSFVAGHCKILLHCGKRTLLCFRSCQCPPASISSSTQQPSSCYIPPTAHKRAEHCTAYRAAVSTSLFRDTTRVFLQYGGVTPCWALIKGI